MGLKDKDKILDINKLLRSFKYAFQGLLQSVLNEQNLRIEAFIGFFAIILAVILGISTIEWVTIIILCGLVLSLELVNTAIEAVVDLSVGHAYHDLAKIAKDAAAASVLLAAIISLIIGLIIFLPKLFDLIGSWGLF